jgi:hypothetical protein
MQVGEYSISKLLGMVSHHDISEVQPRLDIRTQSIAQDLQHVFPILIISRPLTSDLLISPPSEA